MKNATTKKRRTSTSFPKLVVKAIGDAMSEAMRSRGGYGIGGYEMKDGFDEVLKLFATYGLKPSFVDDPVYQEHRASLDKAHEELAAISAKLDNAIATTEQLDDLASALLCEIGITGIAAAEPLVEDESDAAEAAKRALN